MQKFKNLLPVLILGLVITVIYLPLTGAFFQQDEWLGIARFLSLKDQSFFSILQNFFTPSGAHFAPLAVSINSILFRLFNLNYAPYVINSLLLHIIVSLIVFFLSKMIFKNFWLAFFTSALFAVNASSYQATAWVLADTSVHFSTIFAFISIILLFKFFQSKKILNFAFSIISLVISLLFKEISIGLFLLLTILFILFSKMSLKESKKYMAVIFIVGLIYGFFRIGIIHMPMASTADKTVTTSQPLKYLAYNFITLPFKSISQSIIPSSVLSQASYFLGRLLPDSLTGVKDTPDYDKFVQKKILEVISITISLGIILLSIVLWKKNKSNIGKITIFSLIFISVNSFIFALSPETQGRIFIIDSRNLYLLSFGSPLLLVSIITFLTKNNFFKGAILIFFIFTNIYWLNTYLSDLSRVGSLRKNILNTIYQTYPKLPKKVIFYTESDRSFYGLPPIERIMPFQSGFGQTLLVWYDPSENFPEGFFKNKFLWEILDQGYQEKDSAGFGYFRDFDLLLKALENNKLDINSVISFRFDSISGNIFDNTNEVRGRIRGYFSQKNKLSPDEYSIFPSENKGDILNAVDGNRETFWSSKLPYKNPQYILISLRNTYKVAKVEIDSYNNRNQNEVGYEVMLSLDGKLWKNVFHANRFPPNVDGLTDIYFEPIDARFIKIEQIGHHDFAPWVIHELNVYTKL